MGMILNPFRFASTSTPIVPSGAASAASVRPATSVTVDVSGLTNGELMVAAVGAYSTSAIGTPSGWTSLGASLFGTAYRVGYFYKVKSGDTSVTWSGFSNDWGSLAQVFAAPASNVTLSTPVVDSNAGITLPDGSGSAAGYVFGYTVADSTDITAFSTDPTGDATQVGQSARNGTVIRWRTGQWYRGDGTTSTGFAMSSAGNNAEFGYAFNLN